MITLDEACTAIADEILGGEKDAQRIREVVNIACRVTESGASDVYAGVRTALGDQADLLDLVH